MKIQKEKLLNGAIVLGVIATAILAGFIFVSQKSSSQSKAVPNLSSYTFDSVTIKTDLSKEFAQSLYVFLSTTTKASVLPKEIILTLSVAGKDDQGNTYISSWNKDGNFISVLLGLTKDNKHINYERVWMMLEAEEVTGERANTLLATIFSDSWLKDIGPVTCKPAIDPKNKSATECAKMKTVDSGDLLGVTVRTPVELTPPSDTTPPPNYIAPAATAVSACFVPKEGTPLYHSSACI